LRARENVKITQSTVFLARKQTPKIDAATKKGSGDRILNIKLNGRLLRNNFLFIKHYFMFIAIADFYRRSVQSCPE